MKKLILSLILLMSVPTMASVSEGESIREYFTLGAATTDFLFTQPADSSDDILVYKRFIDEDSDTEGNETLLTEDTDYTISPTGGDYINGGTVVTGSALGVNFEVVIVRKMEQSQETNKGAITPTSIITIVDRLTRQVQDLQDRIDRSVRLQQSDETSFDMEIPGLANRAGTFWFWNSAGELTFVDDVVTAGSITTTPYTTLFLTKTTAALAATWLELGTADAVEFAGVTIGANSDFVGSVSSGITIGTNAFTVADDDSGDTAIAGTLEVTGIATLGDGSLATTQATTDDSTKLATTAYTHTLTEGGDPSANDSDATDMLKSHTYLTQSAGFVTAFITNDENALSGYVGATDNPVGVGTLVATTTVVGNAANDPFISFFVGNGKYFEVIAVGVPTIIYTAFDSSAGAPADQD